MRGPKRLKISVKIILMTSSVLFLIMAIFAGYSIAGEYTRFKREASDYENNELARINEMLKNYINMAFLNVQAYYDNARSPEYLEKFYGHRLENIIDIAESIIQKYIDDFNFGNLSLGDAKSGALASIKNIRFDGGTGYVWVNEAQGPIPKMVMHPISPELDGKLLDNPKYNCALGIGKNLFQAFVEVCGANGDGYVDYLWPKPTEDGTTSEQPKLSYVRLIEDWDWIIGAGIYIDDAEREAKENALDTLGNLRYDNGAGYFWVNSNNLPYPAMIMHPISPELNNKVLDDPQYNRAGESNKNIFQAFAEVCRDYGEGTVRYTWPKPTNDGLTQNQPKLSYVKLFGPWDWIIGTGVYTDDIYASIDNKRSEMRKSIISSIWISVIIFIISLAIGIFAALFIARSATKPLGGEPWQIENLAETVASGDLSPGADNDGRDYRGAFKALHQMASILLEIIGEVQSSVSRNYEESGELSSTAESLSSAASEQASLAEELASSVEHITDTIFINTDKAVKTKKIADSVMSDLTDGKTLMERSHKSSQSINKRIQVINDIARQTKILALNAAIEAAKADEYGKGFAVVAEEVRKLSDKSSETAAEIYELSNNSTNIIEETDQKFLSIFPQLKTLIENMSQITNCCDGEKTNIGQIKGAMNQLRSIVEHNASSSEQLAAMAEELNKQSEQINQKISFFSGG